MGTPTSSPSTERTRPADENAWLEGRGRMDSNTLLSEARPLGDTPIIVWRPRRASITCPSGRKHNRP
jgi:hypothetical protein